MKTAAWILTHALASTLALSSGAHADVLETRDGRILDGKFLGGTQQSVRFEVDGSVEVFAVESVLALTFNSDAGQAAAKPAPAPPVAQAEQTRAPSSAKGTNQRQAAAPPSAPPAPAKPQAADPGSTQTAGATRTAAPAAPAAAAKIIRVPAGTRLQVRMADTVDPRRATDGDRFSATLETELVIDGRVVAPARSKVYGAIAEAKTTGPVSARLKLELTELMIQGQMFTILTSTQKSLGAEPNDIVEAPAKAAPGPASGRVASGALLEFRLLQPFEIRTR